MLMVMQIQIQDLIDRKKTERERDRKIADIYLGDQGGTLVRIRE